MSKTITIPKLSLVLLVGPAGAGKSTFAAKHFAPTEIVSSDALRAMIDDDENSQGATNDAFEVLRLIAGKRLARGRLTVVDATNARTEDRRPLIKLAQQHHAACVAIVLDVDVDTCLKRNEERGGAAAPRPNVIKRQAESIAKSASSLRREGLYRAITLSPDQIDDLTIERERMRADRCDERGPFDIIGDVHGCFDELQELLRKCDYAPDEQGVWRHPEGRRAIFLGDIINRGPRSIDCLCLVMDMVEAGSALCVPGNHENLLMSWLKGQTLSPGHGLRQTMNELDHVPDEEYKAFKARCSKFLTGLESHLILDRATLVVAHAGMTADMAGRMGVRRFALYGETRGEFDGFTRRAAPLWAQKHRAKTRVIYGHSAVPEPKRINNTLNIDTGCVFGGKLTAFRYPEGEAVFVEAKETYFEPVSRPRKKGKKAKVEEAPKAAEPEAPEADTESVVVPESEEAVAVVVEEAVVEAPMIEEVAPGAEEAVVVEEPVVVEETVDEAPVVEEGVVADEPSPPPEPEQPGSYEDVDTVFEEAEAPDETPPANNDEAVVADETPPADIAPTT